MRMPPRLVAATLTATLVLTAASDPDPNLERLRAMPLSQRQRLMEALRGFDALPGAEQEAIRELDRQLESLPEDERARLLQVMHSYHRWLGGLSDADRLRVEQADPAERIALVGRLREARRQQQVAARPARGGQGRGAYLDLLQVSSLCSEPLLVSAIELSVWFELPAAVRAEIRKLPSTARQHERFAQKARETGGFQAHAQTILDRAGVGQVVPLRLEIAKLLNLRPDANIPARLKAAQQRPRLEVAFKKGMFDFLQGHEPEPVEPARLRRFETEMPTWVRDSMDPLPPEAAARRLIILYRLVFPKGQEIPEPAPRAKGKAAKPPGSPPRIGPDRPPNPF